MSLPPSSDPRWGAWTSPLFAYLAEPRRFDELRTWARGHEVSKDVLFNMLAWLSLHKRIDRRREGKVVIWYRL